MYENGSIEFRVKQKEKKSPQKNPPHTPPTKKTTKQTQKNPKHQPTVHVVLIFHRDPKRPFMYTFSPLHIKDKF